MYAVYFLKRCDAFDAVYESTKEKNSPFRAKEVAFYVRLNHKHRTGPNGWSTLGPYISVSGLFDVIHIHSTPPPMHTNFMSIQQLFRIDNNNPFLSHRWVINISATFKSNLSILFVHLSVAGEPCCRWEIMDNRCYQRNRITIVHVRAEDASTADEEILYSICSITYCIAAAIPFRKVTNSR